MAFYVKLHTDPRFLAQQFTTTLGLKPPDHDPLQSEYLLVQTPGLKQWLTLEAARDGGICAGLEILAPKAFVMKLGFLLAGEREERSVFEVDLLYWAVLAVLEDPSPEARQALGALHRHLDQVADPVGREIRRLALAREITRVLDDYQLYRPEWLATWARGGHLKEGAMEAEHQLAEQWQRWLWRRIVAWQTERAQSQGSYLDRLQRLLDSPPTADQGRRRLPRRVFVFGMAAFPPSYLAVFSVLAQRLDVHLYLHVPSPHYFGDLVTDRRWLADRAGSSFTGLTGAYDGRGNRLLANLGRQGAETLDLLIRELPDETVLKEAPFPDLPEDGPSLLQTWQASILHCEEGPVRAEEGTGWDESLHLVPCPGALREVEVLRDALRSAFADLPDLSPDQVLIVSPDLETYGPLGEMILGPVFPLSIAGLPDAGTSPEDRFARDLLAVAVGRGSLPEVLDLFVEWAALYSRALDPWEQRKLRTWGEQAGIRWGLDPALRMQRFPVAHDEGTWRGGLDRLWSAWASHQAGVPADWCGPTLPEPGPEGLGEGEVLARLSAFVEALEDLSRTLDPARSWTLDQWIPQVMKPLEPLVPRPEDETELSSFHRALGDLHQQARDLASLQVPPVRLGSHALVRTIVETMDLSAAQAGFLRGRMTMTSMVPLRSVPHRVVAILGMNRGTFPRRDQEPAWNLMAREGGRRAGDPGKLEADRYLFLETLLMARDRLWISWTQDEDRGPSVLVDLVLQDLEQRYGLRAGDRHPALARGVHPLHPFSRKYLASEGPSTWEGRWFTPRQDPELGEVPFLWRFPIADHGRTLGSPRLASALAKPLAHFMREGLGAREAKALEPLMATETFSLDSLQQWKVRDAILEDLVKTPPAGYRQGPSLRDYYRARAILPPGNLGDLAWDLEERRVESRVRRIRNRHPTLVLDALHLGGTWTSPGGRTGAWEIRERLMGLVPRSAEGGLRQAIVVEAGRLLDREKRLGHPKRLLRHWINHLMLNLQEPTATVMVALDKALGFPATDIAEARERLGDLAALEQEARTRFLPLFPAVGLSWLQQKNPGDFPADKLWDLATQTLHADEETFLIQDLMEPHEDLPSWFDQWPEAQKEFTTLALRLWEPLLAAAAKEDDHGL